MTLAAASLAFAGFAHAETAQAGPVTQVTFTTDSTSATVTGIVEGTTPTSLTIPANLGGKPVTAIANNAFGELSGITSVTLPSGLKSIGNWAFNGTGLTSISLPSGLTTIGTGAFYGVTGITSIVIPNSVTDLGEYSTFGDMTGLESVTLPSGLTNIPDYGFSGDTALKTITLPSTVTYIGNGAFNGASSLTSLTIPSGVTVINPSTFMLSGLTSLTIPEGVTEIGDNALQQMPALASISLPSTLTSIGNGAFDKTATLSSVTIPDSVSTIGYYAFARMPDLKSITLSSSLTTIPYAAFFLDTALTEITIPAGVTTIKDSAFWLSSSLKTVRFAGNAPTVEGTYALKDLASGATATLANSSLTGYGFNGDKFNGLTVTGGLDRDITAPVAPGSFTGVPSSPTSAVTATIGFTKSESGGSVECKLDSGSWSSCTFARGTSGSQTLTGLADGVHTLSVRHTDAAGNVSETATTSSWTVDTTAPAAPGLSGVTSGSTTDTGASISFIGEANATFTCSVDGGSYSACGSSPKVLSGLAVGAHSLSVKATDQAGNTSVAATASWTVAAPVAAPTVLTPAAGTKTVYKATGTWAIKVGLLFSTGGDTRSASQFLTVQVAVDSSGKPVSTKPSDTLAPPAAATFANGVVSWSATGEVTRNTASAPVWVRVGNKAGKWSGWVKLTA